MQIKDYQQRVLDRLTDYLNALITHEAILQQIPAQLRGNVTYDVPRKAWEQVIGRDTYKSYENGLGEGVPHICFKVPTGGGKTYLAGRAIELIQHKFQQEQTGLVLWIVPTKAIFQQTLTALRDKRHVYRHTLDKASGGKTLIVEKGDLFTQSDVKENIVVLLLMLQSGNRKNREKELNLFKGQGGFMNFFPNEGNQSEHRALHEQIPNLAFEGGIDQFFGVTIKPSLGNVIRLLKPLVILDESHRASSELSHETRKDFNPSFVLELSATPKPESNILVNVSGQELHQEEMIKLDLHVTTKDNVEWQNTLLAGVEKIKYLTHEATIYKNNGNPYIRPIAVISVERTGKKEDTGKFIHANNARDYLIQQGISPQAIAIKSADIDELKDVDLLSETCPIQYVITKNALQEGWDCPFAYVLVLLNNTKSTTSLKQLVGRILRQPYAKKTGILALDESYVFCHQQAPKAVVEAIANGFRIEGLDDLTSHVVKDSDAGGDMIRIPYRQEFSDWTIYLPRFVVREGDDIRPISYIMDVAPHIHWDELSLDGFQINKTTSRSQEHRLTLGLGNSSYNPLFQRDFEEVELSNELKPDYFVRQIGDIIPNEWRAWRVVNTMINKLKESYAPAEIANRAVEISEELRRFLSKQIDGYFADEIDSIGLAGETFLRRIEDDEIIFFLEKMTDYALPKSITMQQDEKVLVRSNNKPVQRSLFEEIPERLFNDTEKAVALYLDEQHNLLWWYRHLVGAKYSLQGWRNNRIFTDFVTAHKRESEEYSTVYVLETKGSHLSGNDDTRYKQEIFKICNREGAKIRWEDLGQGFSKYHMVEFHMVFDFEWKQKINKLFNEC